MLSASALASPRRAGAGQLFHRLGGAGELCLCVGWLLGGFERLASGFRLLAGLLRFFALGTLRIEAIGLAGQVGLLLRCLLRGLLRLFRSLGAFLGRVVGHLTLLLGQLGGLVGRRVAAVQLVREIAERVGRLALRLGLLVGLGSFLSLRQGLLRLLLLGLVFVASANLLRLLGNVGLLLLRLGGLRLGG